MSQSTSPTNRFPALTEDTMTDAQREMVADIKGFSLNGLRGPYNMMLRSPEAAKRFQHLGKYIRFETGIDERLIELAVLIHARVWSDQYEWYLHAPRALEAGLSEDKVEALRLGQVPEGMSEDESVIFAYVLELEVTHKVSDDTFARALSLLGEQVVTDLVFMMGQYTTISMILAVLGEGRDLDLLPPCEHPFEK